MRNGIEKEEMLVGLMIEELDDVKEQIVSQDWDEAIDALNWVYSQIRRIVDKKESRGNSKRLNKL